MKPDTCWWEQEQFHSSIFKLCERVQDLELKIDHMIYLLAELMRKS